MRAPSFLLLLPFLFPAACFAGGGLSGGYSGGAPAGTAAPMSGYPSGGYANPYAVQPFGNPYMGNPYMYQQRGVPYYHSPYGGYATPYGYTGGVIPAFQPYGGNCYGVNFNGANLRLWRSTSGYYYPWVPGYNYNTFPIFIVPQGQTNPAPALPPISVLVTDLNDYLDKAKEKGKVSDSDFTSLKRRASDLLSKEKSLAYAAGGQLDPDQESDIRRDVDQLSGEVARRVRP